jgi:peptidoglycan/LPS O-acetylase OafA/YrhL
MVSSRAIDIAGAPPAPSEQAQRGYQPALDGLRALAVFAVMAYHVALPFAVGGWIGVDVFFVLSGFLITRVLMSVHVGPWRRSLRSFYLRRALRLLPALVVLLAFTFVSYAIVGPHTLATRQTLVGVPASFFYVANWLPALGITNLGFLGHMWSLSVEEHFYMLWPMLFRALWSASPRRTAKRVALALGAAAAYRVYLVASGASLNRLYTGTDARAEELFVGCLLAVLFTAGLSRLAARRPMLWHCAAFIAVVGLVGAAIALPVGSRFVPRGGSTLIELAAALVIANIVLFPRAIVSRLLAFRPLVWLGRRSYGIYLWHLPLGGLAAALVPVGDPLARFFNTALIWVATISVAALSYRFVERPFMSAHPPRTAIEELDLRRTMTRPEVDQAVVDPAWQSVPAQSLARAR